MILVAHVLVHTDAWCIGASARAMLRYCDDMSIGLHASTDGTEDVLEDLSREHPGRVTVVEQDSCFPKAVPPSWWAGLDGSRQHLKPELPPWQEGLCRELVGRHGREFFAGINGLESIP